MITSNVINTKKSVLYHLRTNSLESSLTSVKIVKTKIWSIKGAKIVGTTTYKSDIGNAPMTEMKKTDKII